MTLAKRIAGMGRPFTVQITKTLDRAALKLLWLARLVYLQQALSPTALSL